MPNTFLTPDMIAREGLATLYNTIVAAQLVHRDFDSDFDGAVGDTITVRKPTTFESKVFDRNNGIDLQNATETGVPVALDTLLDVSFPVTAEELTLDIRDFGAQLLDPAMEAHAQKIDSLILGLRDDIVAEVGQAADKAWNEPGSLIDAGRVLNQAKVPASQRYVIAGPITTAEWLLDPLFHQADQRGDTEGLREASIGRKFGFDVYMSQGIEAPASTPDPGDPTTEVNVAFHRTAFALVSRTLAMPRGADEGRAAVVSYRGLGLRVVNDYDISKKQDVISCDVLVGVTTLDANRAVLIKGADEASS